MPNGTSPVLPFVHTPLTTGGASNVGATADAPSDATQAGAPARRGMGTMLNDLRQTRGAKYTLKALTIAYKTYMGFLAVNSAMLVGKHPRDLVQNPTSFLVNGVLLGVPRADMMTVQESHNAVIKEYGKWIQPEECGKPTITFVNKLKMGGDRVNGFFMSDTQRSGTISLNTYNLNLAQTAAHEYLHCYSEQFSRNLWDTDSLTSVQARQIEEGITELFTQKIGIKSGVPAIQKSIYPDEVKLAKKILKDIGLETLKNAYFKNDPDAMVTLIESARGHLKQDDSKTSG